MRTGTDQHGCRWMEFEIDPSHGRCECGEPECDPNACPRFVTECSICGELVRGGWFCLNRDDDACDDCVEFSDPLPPIWPVTGDSMSTYRTMTTEHLGANSTEQDLAWFCAACRARQADTGETDEQVTDYMWGNGDWPVRASQYAEMAEVEA